MTKICTLCKKEKDITMFYIGESLCKECKSIKSKETYQKNKENILIRHKKYNEDHKEELKNLHAKYYIENKETINKKNKDWWKNNPTIIRMYYEKNIEKFRKNSKLYSKTELGKITRSKANFNRRTKYQNCINDFTLKDWTEIQENQNYKCIYCGEKLHLTIDHIVPISKGGNHTKSNIQGLCLICNSKKHNKIDSTAMMTILTNPQAYNAFKEDEF